MTTAGLKRKAEASGPTDEGQNDSDAPILTEYEKARAIIIARNLARLEALGIQSSVKQLDNLVEDSKQAKKQAKTKKAKAAQIAAPAVPTRRSRRRQGQVEGEKVEDDDDGITEADRQLGIFIIDGECPKCGRVFLNAHAKHLAACTGRPQKEEPSLAERIELEIKKIKTDEKKLQELDLGGLIELTEDHATFMVVGSTGRHYKVELNDVKRKCQCVDHRCRKHDCKHIRLVLKTLGIEKEPQGWHAAVKDLVMKHSGGLESVKPDAGGPRKAEPLPPSADAVMAAKFL